MESEKDNQLKPISEEAKTERSWNKDEFLEEIEKKSDEFAASFLQAIHLEENPIVKNAVSSDWLNMANIRRHVAGTIYMLMYVETAEQVQGFIDEVKENATFITEINATPQILLGAFLDIYKHKEIFSDKNKLINFFYNARLYEQEGVEMEKRLEDRLTKNPAASEQELSAGVYKEALESQVADAIFILRRKGYNTFESGFGDKVNGEQYVGFDNPGVPTTNSILSPEAIAELKRYHVSATVEIGGDRLKISLLPEENMFSLEEWKKIWLVVAELLLPLENSASKQNVHTPNATEFVLEQEKLKRGEDADLGYGFRYSQGRVVKS